MKELFIHIGHVKKVRAGMINENTIYGMDNL